MNPESIYHWFSRLFFFVGLGLLAIAALEGVMNFAGYTILRGYYSKGRLIEIAAALLVFVITVLLRQIRDELKAARRA